MSKICSNYTVTNARPLAVYLLEKGHTIIYCACAVHSLTISTANYAEWDFNSVTIIAGDYCKDGAKFVNAALSLFDSKC